MNAEQTLRDQIKRIRFKADQKRADASKLIVVAESLEEAANALEDAADRIDKPKEDQCASS